MSQPSSGKKLKRPVDQIRAELLADPDTQAIAQAVRMKLEDYVDLVLDYLQNPDKEPVVNVVPDDQLRAAGYDAPSAEEVANFFISAAKGDLGIAGSQFEKSEFEKGGSTAGKPALINATGAGAPAASSAQPAARPELLDQVKRGSTGGRF